MAYQALYRKYRPSKFSDFIDQDYVKKILVNSILNNKISHAYLFSGPRGIGKTSMAKIFAKAINCLNFLKNNDVCDECENCCSANENSVDIIEIDAASNNGVDQIRDLKSKITIMPSKLKYKVYIIDEVHMLTNSAFNALLKTLEEPPSHIVFILATTEFYEVPETIVSRCQCFNFTRITQNSLEKRLKYISEKENIKIDDEAIAEIAHFSNGGLRDAIGMLDKINAFTNERITVDIFKSINGMISQEDIADTYDYIINSNLAKILEMINKVETDGYDFKNFIERIMLLARDKIVNYYTKPERNEFNVKKNVELISTLNDILNHLKDAVNPLVIVQIYLLRFVENFDKVQNNDKKENKINEKIISQEIIPENIDHLKKDKTPVSGELKINEDVKKVRINNAMATANIHYKNELIEVWNGLSHYFMDDKYSKVAQLLSDTEIKVVGSSYLILSTNSLALMNNIYQNLVIVEDFINKIYRNLLIVLVTDEEFEKIKKKYIEDKKNNIVYKIEEECGKLVEEKSNLINQAINVFGSDLVEIE